jgi:hypothetical protein
MPILARRKSKPNPGVGIDPGWRSLVSHAWTLNEGSGPFTEAISGQSIALNAGTTWVSTPYGWGLQNATDGLGTIATVLNTPLAAPYSVSVLFQVNTANLFAEVVWDSGFSGIFNNGTTLSLLNTGAGVAASVSSALVNQSWAFVTLTITATTGGTAGFYVNGQSLGSQSFTGTIALPTRITLGRRGTTGGGPNTPGTPFALCLYHPLILDAEACAAFAGNPWQIFESPRIQSFYRAGSTVGGSATLSAATGVFSFSGNAANLLAGRVLGAATGAYGLTGQAAALLSGRVLPAATGTFAETGNDAGLLAGRVLAASTGVYALAGNDAGLLAGRVIAASTGVYVLTGNNANLVYTQPGAYTLVAGTGVFNLTGNAASLLASRVLPASTGAFAFTGNAATLVYTPSGAGAYVLVADTGVFSLTGSDAGLLASRVLAAAPGSFALSSVGASLTWSGHITPSFVDPDEITMITP